MKNRFKMLNCIFALSMLTANGYAATKVEPVKTEPHITLAHTVPACRAIQGEVYGEYLFLQPNGSDLYYAAQAIGLNPNLAVPAISPQWKILEIDPSYHSGFEVGLKTLFSDPRVVLDLNWERLHAHDEASYTTSPDAGYMVGPISDIGPNSSSYKTAQGHVDFHFDQVNLDFGREFLLLGRLRATVFGGVGFARIKQKMESNYTNLGTAISRSFLAQSLFIGAGPQFGLFYNYRIFKGLLLTGESVAAFFMGQQTNRAVYQSTTPELAALGVSQPNVQSTQIPHRTQLVPAFEQRIGMAYEIFWNCTALTVGLGYRCQAYLDAVQTMDMTAPQVLPSGTTFSSDTGLFAVGFERTLSNFLLSGFYASIDIKF